jgi:uncharacterized protein (DUF302 family)
MQLHYSRTAGFLITCMLFTGCASADKLHNNVANASIATYQTQVKVPAGMPAINYKSAIYEVAVKDGVSYQDVVDSLKSISEGKNFVNPANFPIGDHMKLRGQAPVGVLEVGTFCNLGLGAVIMLDHPEFVVFAPCRVALYEKPNVQKQLQLYLALDRPTFDLQSIQAPTPRAVQAAIDLETQLIDMLDKARRGDF